MPSAPGLKPLLDPRSVVLVGATPQLTRIGGIPLAALLARGFPRARILLVNPRHEAIEGLRCYPEIAALPYVPDLAIVAVPARAALESLRALAALGVPAAVLFAAGFGEDPAPAGQALEKELRAFLATTSMRVAGPNSMGVANILTGMSASFLSTLAEELPKGGLALVGQSGNTVSMMVPDARDYGLGLSFFVSSGNEVNVDFADYLAYFWEDRQVSAVLGYVEGVRDGPRFMEVAAGLRAAGKPLFLAKVGRSEKAREAAFSHTGALTGDATVQAAALRQLGVAVCRDPTEVMDVARLWAAGERRGMHRGGEEAPEIAQGVAIVSLSGAGCAFLADLFADAGVAVPTLGEKTQQALRAVIPSYGMVGNPVDLTGNVINDMGALATVLAVLAAADEVGCIVLYLMGSLLDGAADILLAAPRGKLLAVIDPSHAARAGELDRAGIPVFADSLRAAASLASFLDWRRLAAGRRWQPEAVATEPPPRWIGDILEEEGRRTLDEAEVKRLLAGSSLVGNSLAMAPERLVASAEEAVAAALALGPPVALKIVDHAIAHKSDVGGVETGLGDARAVHAAWGRIVERIVGRIGQHLPGRRVRQMLVQKMVAGPEVLVGLRRDPTFGAVLTVGLGGLYTEIFRDTATRVLPVDAEMVEEMLAELRSSPLLEGVRGGLRANRPALAAGIAALCRFFAARPWLLELELNPVMATGAGPVAVDGIALLAGGPVRDGATEKKTGKKTEKKTGKK